MNSSDRMTLNRLLLFLALFLGLTESPILAVTDIPGLTEKGAIIGMNVQNQRIVFEVNLKAAQQSTLQLSSKLLNLAARVYQWPD